MIWHGGFPLLALGYALLRDADGGVRIRTSTGRAILGSIIAVGVAISALAWIVTARHDILPTLLSGGHYTPIMIGVVSVVWSLSLAALLALWVRRPHSVLDIWLMVVLCAWLFDIASVGDAQPGQIRSRLLCRPDLRSVCRELRSGGLVDRQCRPAGPVGSPARSRSREATSERDRHTERERLFNAVVESSNDAIITKTLDGTITGWNPAAARLFGFTAAEAVGNRIDIIVPPDRRAETQEILGRIASGEAIERRESLRLHKDGRDVHVGFRRLPDPVAGRRCRRRVQDRARSQRDEEDAAGAGPGNRGAAAEHRDVAGSDPDHGSRGAFVQEFKRGDHSRLSTLGHGRTQCDRFHLSRRSRSNA